MTPAVPCKFCWPISGLNPHGRSPQRIFQDRLIRIADTFYLHLLFELFGQTQNAFIESFNGRFRDECLNDHWFTTLAEARILIAAWRRDYNQHRPHSALDYLAPAEFAAKHRAASPGQSAEKECL